MAPVAGRVRDVAADVWCTAAAFALLAAVEVATRSLPLPTTARWCGVPVDTDDGGRAPAGPFDLAVTHREARRLRATRRVLRHWPLAAGTCLRESLMIGHYLRRRRPVLRIGARMVDGTARFHAWVEVQGAHTGGDGYVALVRTPTPAVNAAG